MKKICLITLAGIALISVSGCGGVNYRETNISIYSGGDQHIDASGATNTTGVDQKSANDLGEAVKLAKSWIDANALKVLEAVNAGSEVIIPLVKKQADIQEVE